MNGLVSLLTGRRSWVLALVGLILGGWLIAGLGQAENDPDPLSQLPAGFESTQGQALLEELPDEGTSAAIVLFTREEGDIASVLPELGEVLTAAAETYGSAGAAAGPPQGAGEPGAPAEGEGQPGGPAEGEGGPPPGVTEGGIPVIPSEDGTAALGVLTVDSASATQAQETVTGLRGDLAEAVPDGVTAQVTGPAAIRADLASVFDGANVTLLAVTAGVVALLLILTYRSPVLWVVPLAVVGVADQVAAVAATHVLKATGVPWDESTIGILSVLVFGAGTNYALLLISRYRDELRTHESRHEAMAVALRRASEAIIASASTVVVGVLCLLLSVFPSTRGLGLACAVGVTVAAVGVLGLLPGALVAFGRWVFWPQVPREGQVVLSESRSVWRRIGDAVATAPAVYVVGTLAVLGAMAFGLTQLRSGLAPEDQFLDTPQAITAAQRLAESFPAGTSDPLLVVSRSDDAAELEELATTLGEVDGVTTATALPPVEGIGQVQLVLEAETGSTASEDTVAAVRGALDGRADTYVTGGEASAVDADAGAVRDRWVVMPLILILVLGALMGLLRSVLAPVILVASVVATFCAALGVSWWIFTGIFGFGAVDATMPLLAFLFLVALGVDYNIFLITRTLEEARGHGTREGVLRALGATGGVITSAGILLAAVFAVLGVLPLVVLAQIGVVICIGVLLDTLVVRTVLVPAIVRLLGERFWWPRKVGPGVGPRHAEGQPEREVEPAVG
ncbi:MMPL family transporter [Ornithinimicrobium cerasi]|uniref:Putative drug exporter of the RND superfamily n=1 Tax=Ornithinimicrobium cerasi TaxID=2248773 RepID=A0A285VR81_9MICO|nr:MMPL family transporter [Ornithinimicrobium cerasi]SOC56545.1 putative drug exporter of the RND superfamily [Ornithinimicrobium cerasi]